MEEREMPASGRLLIEALSVRDKHLRTIHISVRTIKASVLALYSFLAPGTIAAVAAEVS
jgi:hypothetical protein